MIVSNMYKRWHLAGFTRFKKAVEIGTHQGTFAKELLDARQEISDPANGDTEWVLYCVDPWVNPPGYEEQAKLLTGGGLNRDWDYSQAVAITKRAVQQGHCELIRGTSGQAANRFKFGELDLVYLDGDHSFEAVTADLLVWWAKLRSGGVLAGHDFVCPGGNGGWGRSIQPAVTQFAEMRGVDVNLIVEPGGEPWSFYLVKP